MRTILLFSLVFIIGVNAISKYDFNACRISSCNSEEQNCLAEEAGCLNYFATMRNWYLCPHTASHHVRMSMTTSTLAGKTARTPQQGRTLIG
jgi:hypothetical protein